MMAISINPTAFNAIHVGAAAIPSGCAMALLGSGGNTYIALALFSSAILSALAQSLHFNSATVSVINNLPMIIAAVQKAAEMPSPNTEAK